MWTTLPGISRRSSPVYPSRQRMVQQRRSSSGPPRLPFGILATKACSNRQHLRRRTDPFPEDVAWAAVYFLSAEAALINGAILDAEQYPLIGRNPVKESPAGTLS